MGYSTRVRVDIFYPPPSFSYTGYSIPMYHLVRLPHKNDTGTNLAVTITYNC